MKVKKLVSIEKDLKVLGATLPSIEDILSVPVKERVYNNWYWLCSPGSLRHTAGYVSYSGEVYDRATVDCNFGSVRPALILSNISGTDFNVGDVFEICSYRFKIISNTLAWMYEQDLGRYRFDNNTNVYEDSDIKKLVDEWFMKLN